MALPLTGTEVLTEDLGTDGIPFANIEQSTGLNTLDLDIGFNGIPFYGHPFSAGVTFLPIISIFMGGD